MSRRWVAGFLTESYNPFQVPNAPTGVTATAGNAQASVAFTAPANVGGSAITSYTVVSSGGQYATGTSSPITVTGLTNGTSYTFTVYATNSYGPGARSSSSGSITPGVFGQQAYTTAGTYTFTVPAGVTSICVVCVGGGGGGYASGSGVYTGSNGGNSTFNSTTCGAGGGGKSPAAQQPGVGGSVLNGTGVAGANGLVNPDAWFYGGGGGGAGTLAGSAAPNGAGRLWNGGGGYGASITSTGSNAGAPGTDSPYSGPSVSLGGSYGGGGGGGRDGPGGGGGAISYVNNISVTPGQNYTVVVGDGGSPQGSADRTGGYGGPGAVRIIWGPGRSFPSTNIGDM